MTWFDLFVLYPLLAFQWTVTAGVCIGMLKGMLKGKPKPEPGLHGVDIWKYEPDKAEDTIKKRS